MTRSTSYRNARNARRRTQFREREEEGIRETDQKDKNRGKDDLNVIFWNVSGTASMKGRIGTT